MRAISGQGPTPPSLAVSLASVEEPFNWVRQMDKLFYDNRVMPTRLCTQPYLQIDVTKL